MKILLIDAHWKDAFRRPRRWPVVNRTEALRYPALRYPDRLACDTVIRKSAG
jgi:hypothetical protein